jgi:hypothetical protein
MMKLFLYLSTILCRYTGGAEVRFHTSLTLALPGRESTQYPLHISLGSLCNYSECGGDEKKKKLGTHDFPLLSSYRHLWNVMVW